MNKQLIILSSAFIIVFIMLSVPFFHNDIKANSDNLSSIHRVDSDGDYLPDYIEAEYGTDPDNPDSDNDLISDMEEIYLGTSPTDWDTDGDGMADGNEIGVQDESTSPFVKDSDHDGLPDPWEDNDGDGILNREEQLAIHDGVCFYVDIFNYFDNVVFNVDDPPTYSATDPNSADTDGDNLGDGEEIQVNSTAGVVTNPLRDRVNPALDISNPSSYASQFVSANFNWDSGTFADWRNGLRMAGSYLTQVPAGCTSIAWYHFSPFWVYEQYVAPGPPWFNSWRPSFFNSAQNQSLRGAWDRGGPYQWNYYDCDPTLNDTDGDFMDDDWDNYPLRYNHRNGSYAAILGVNRVGSPEISCSAPRTPDWNFFGHNITILELEKGDWIDINISVGVEDCNLTSSNFATRRWDPISVFIQFRRVDLGIDNLPHTVPPDPDFEYVWPNNTGFLTRQFTNVDAQHIISGMVDRNWVNHADQNVKITFYFQKFRVRVPSRVPAGQVALVVETITDNNFFYFPSDEFYAY